MSFAAHQASTAQWLGYSGAAAMNEAHDPLHAALCAWLGVPSHSLACARGEKHDPALAVIEEDAVMRVQRMMAHHGVGVPK